MVAGDRRFNANEPVVHDSETVQTGWPIRQRTVSGTITVVN
jgi:hypothetical protein